jgi:hypothetical protein
VGVLALISDGKGIGASNAAHAASAHGTAVIINLCGMGINALQFASVGKASPNADGAVLATRDDVVLEHFKGSNHASVSALNGATAGSRGNVPSFEVAISRGTDKEGLCNASESEDGSIVATELSDLEKAASGVIKLPGANGAVRASGEDNGLVGERQEGEDGGRVGDGSLGGRGELKSNGAVGEADEEAGRRSNHAAGVTAKVERIGEGAVGVVKACERAIAIRRVQSVGIAGILHQRKRAHRQLLLRKPELLLLIELSITPFCSPLLTPSSAPLLGPPLPPPSWHP